MRKLFLFSLFALLCGNIFAQSNTSFSTSDGWLIAGTFYQGTSDRCVILLHDLEKTRAEFSVLTEKLRKEEFCYLALDLRGHGYSANKGVQTAFSKTGQKNDFNKMAEDVNSAVKYLNNKGFEENNIYLLGVGLGANVAGKSLIKNPHVAGIALFTPSLKQRDVVTLSGMKNYRGPVFIGVSSEDRKQFMEASFIRNASFLHSGEGKVSFVTAYNLRGSEMLNRYMLPEILQWLKTPTLPEIKPDIIKTEDSEENLNSEQDYDNPSDGD